jgi:hypothetical protein
MSRADRIALARSVHDRIVRLAFGAWLRADEAAWHRAQRALRVTERWLVMAINNRSPWARAMGL